MTDFGAGHRRKRSRTPVILGVVIGIGVVAAIVVGSWLWNRSRAIEKARAWAVAGPPCPPASAQAFAAFPVKPHRGFEFDGVTFTRAFGDATCDEVHDDGGRGLGTHQVCRFTAPWVVHVTTHKGDFYFIPLTGPATVTVKDGVPACVRAAPRPAAATD